MSQTNQDIPYLLAFEWYIDLQFNFLGSFIDVSPTYPISKILQTLARFSRTCKFSTIDVLIDRVEFAYTLTTHSFFIGALIIEKPSQSSIKECAHLFLTSFHEFVHPQSMVVSSSIILFFQILHVDFNPINEPTSYCLNGLVDFECIQHYMLRSRL